MNKLNPWHREMIDRMIIIFLGILTIGVLMQSCGPVQHTCAAYDSKEQIDH
ncbi:MAG: hypothetical protein ACKOZY_01105 [Flavobacteriales bacterium]